MQELDSEGKPLHLHVSLLQVQDKPLHLEGELSPLSLDLEEDEWANADSGIRYVLDAEVVGDELLLRGTIEADLELHCSRSGGFFSTTLGDSSFLRSLSISELPESLDLTEEMREAVLIQIPSFPVSPEAQSDGFELPEVPGNPSDPEDENDSPWSTLDGLELS